MRVLDGFEGAGGLLGSVFLVGLRVGAFVLAPYRRSIRPWQAELVWFRPGFVVGMPPATWRLRVICRLRWAIAAMNRMLALGATRLEDGPYPLEATFVWLRRPGDNEFCSTEPVDFEAGYAVTTRSPSPLGGAHG